MQPDDKDAALLPRRIDGSFALIHRPMTDSGAHIWISFSPDLRNWGGHKLMLQARKGAWWDANKVGLSPPLIETPRGWLMLYHGVRHTAAGCLYRLGVALFDLDQPEHCLLRGDSWIFGPEAPYEREGDVGNVTFPCGYTLGADGDTINLYYGAADTSIALATGSVRQLLRLARRARDRIVTQAERGSGIVLEWRDAIRAPSAFNACVFCETAMAPMAAHRNREAHNALAYNTRFFHVVSHMYRCDHTSQRYASGRAYAHKHPVRWLSGAASR